jgi:hypothetical protein
MKFGKTFGKRENTEMRFSKYANQKQNKSKQRENSHKKIDPEKSRRSHWAPGEDRDSTSIKSKINLSKHSQQRENIPLSLSSSKLTQKL